MDRFDALGLVGLSLVTAGVWNLTGWAWASVFVGAVLVLVYGVREIRAIVRG